MVTQKDYLFCFIWVLKVSLRLTLIQNGGLCPLRLLPLMTVLCVYALSGYSSREQMARERFFEGLQNYMENKMKKIKTK